MSADKKKCSACGKCPCVCLLTLAQRSEPAPCPTCGKGGEKVKASLAAWTAGTVLLPHLHGAEALDAMGWWRNCKTCKSTYILTAHAAQARVELSVAA